MRLYCRHRTVTLVLAVFGPNASVSFAMLVGHVSGNQPLNPLKVNMYL